MMFSAAALLAFIQLAAPADPCVQFFDRPRNGEAEACAKDPGCPGRVSECVGVIRTRTECIQDVVRAERGLGVRTCDGRLFDLDPRHGDLDATINRELDRTREDYDSIKRWVSKVTNALRKPSEGTKTADLSKAAKAADLDALRKQVWSRLRPVLRDRGLYEPIFGELVTGTSSATVGSETEDLKPEQAQKAAYVVFESRHQDLVGRFDASLAGRFGFQPLFAMYHPANAGEVASCGGGTAVKLTTLPPGQPSSTPCLPAFQSGFLWELGGKLNLRVGWGGEGSAFYRGGQSRLLGPGVIAGGDSDAPEVALPVGRGEGPTRWAHEAGLKWVLFIGDDENDRAHERRILDPLLEVSAGWRRDDRFRPELFATSNDPRERYFFRFFVNVKVPGRDLVDKPLAVTFGVEHEGAFRGGEQALPSGTRFILRGDLNLIKALTGGGS